jgi:hypothetical protein
MLTEELQERLFEGFASLKEALRNLTEELAVQAAQPAGPGHDMPDGPERRSA